MGRTVLPPSAMASRSRHSSPMSYEVYSVSSSLAPCPPWYLQVAMRRTMLQCAALCCNAPHCVVLCCNVLHCVALCRTKNSVSYCVAILPRRRRYIAQCVCAPHRARTGKNTHARARQRTDAQGYVVRMALKRTDIARRRCGRHSGAIRRNTTRQEHVHARTHTEAGTDDDAT
jgi:hypothetical protein